MCEWDTHPDSDEGRVWCNWLAQASKEHDIARTRGRGREEWLKAVARRSTPSPEVFQRILEKMHCSLKQAAEEGVCSEESSQLRRWREGRLHRSWGTMGAGLLTESTVVIMGRVSREQRSEVWGHEADVWEWEWGLSDFTGSLTCDGRGKQGCAALMNGFWESLLSRWALSSSAVTPDTWPGRAAVKVPPTACIPVTAALGGAFSTPTGGLAIALVKVTLKDVTVWCPVDMRGEATRARVPMATLTSNLGKLCCFWVSD